MSNDSGRINLPAINANKFNASFQHLASITFPAPNHEASVKGRINILEAGADAQADFNNTTIHTFSELNDSLHSAEDAIKLLLKQSQDAFDAKLAQLKKEYDHRFELQASENKRLQNHISTLKSDSHMIKHKLQSTIEKLRKLQNEFGGPDGDFDEESSILFSTMSVSRPPTSSQPL